MRLAMFGAMGAMLVASLAVPDVFGDDAVLFTCAYAVVRIAHLVLYAVAGRGDRELLKAVARLGAGSAVGIGLLFCAADPRRQAASHPLGDRARLPISSAPTSAAPAGGISRRGTSSSGTG